METFFFFKIKGNILSLRLLIQTNGIKPVRKTIEVYTGFLFLFKNQI